MHKTTTTILPPLPHHSRNSPVPSMTSASQLSFSINKPQITNQVTTINGNTTMIYNSSPEQPQLLHPAKVTNQHLSQQLSPITPAKDDSAFDFTQSLKLDHDLPIRGGKELGSKSLVEKTTNIKII